MAKFVTFVQLYEFVGPWGDSSALGMLRGSRKNLYGLV